MSQDHSAETAVHVQDQTAGEPSSAAPSPAALDTDAPVEETAASVVPESKPAAKPVSGFMAGLLGGAAVTLVTLATVTVAWPLVRDQLLGADGNRLSLLERQSDELSQKVALLQGQVSNQSEGAGATLSNSLNQRLTSLEQRLSSADEDPRLSSLSQKMDQTTADNAHLRDEMGQLRNSIPPEGLILRLAERAESAERPPAISPASMPRLRPCCWWSDNCVTPSIGATPMTSSCMPPAGSLRLRKPRSWTPSTSRPPPACRAVPLCSTACP